MHARALLSDRFSVSLMLALGIHAAVLLGISFALDFNPLQKAAETLDVVLVNWKSEDPPDEAEFLAEAARQGGGESEEAQKPSQEMAPEVPSLAEGDMPVSSPEVMPQPATDVREQLTAENPDARPAQQLTQVEQPEAPVPSVAELMQQSMQVARMQPDSVREQDFQSRLPRREFISASTREYKYATYMHAWVSKVERVGNLNYPVELKRRKMSGDLMMTVGVNRDGSVESISIRRGSGIPELDRAAERIVRLAAPYSPLPADIASDVDVLHITRTWRFSHGDVFE
jgi:protein TonB